MTFSWYPRATKGLRDVLARAGAGREAANKDFLIDERSIVGRGANVMRKPYVQNQTPLMVLVNKCQLF